MTSLRRIRNAVFRTIIRIACYGLGAERVERILLFGCRRTILRKIFRLGSLAYEFCAYLPTLTDDTLRLARLDRYQRYVNLRELPGISEYFFGISDTLPFINILLREGDIAIDAGANTGQYTLLMAALVQPTGHVYAFEPDQQSAQVLAQSITANRWETCIDIDTRALWKEQRDQVKFYLSQNPKMRTSSLVLHGYDVSNDHYIEVATITLDQYFAEHQITHCRLIKIDVERAEFEMLQGFSHSLKNHLADFILIEMLGHSPSQNLLSECGYTGFLVKKGSGLIEMSQVSPNTFGDYLFISPNALSEFERLRPHIQAVLH
jgi:FkbM family methyltransferase